MKIRLGFVSNSSSASFVIRNKTSESKTFRHFIEENPWMLDKFPYVTKAAVLLDCASRRETIQPGDNSFTFGDHAEDGPLEQVLHYCLTDEGESENFSWGFLESYH